MILYEMFRNCGDAAFVRRCRCFENMYIIYSKYQFALNVRLFLEAYADYKGWSGSNLHDRIKNASGLSNASREDLYTIKNFANYAHHNPEEDEPGNSEIYKKYDKQQIMEKLCRTLAATENTTLTDVDLSLFVSSYTFGGEDYRIDERYNAPDGQYLFRKCRGDDIDRDLQVFVRCVPKPQLNNLPRIEQCLKGTDVSDRIIFSRTLSYSKGDSHVLALELGKNQLRLSDVTNIKHNAETAVWVAHRLINDIIRPLSSKGIAHRNIRPNAVVLQSRAGGRINCFSPSKDNKDDYILKLSCFENAKCSFGDTVAIEDRLLLEIGSPYLLSNIVYENKSTTLLTGKAMDAYAIAELIKQLCTDKEELGNALDTSLDKVTDFANVTDGNYDESAITALYDAVADKYAELFKTEQKKTEQKKKKKSGKDKADESEKTNKKLLEENRDLKARVEELEKKLQQPVEMQQPDTQQEQPDARDKHIPAVVGALCGVILLLIAVIVYLLMR